MVRSPADIKQCNWKDFKGIIQRDTHGGTSFLVAFLRKWTYPTVLSTFLFLVILINFSASFGVREAPYALCENWCPHWGRKRQNSAVSHPNIVGNLAKPMHTTPHDRSQLLPRRADDDGQESWVFFVSAPRDKGSKSIAKQIILLPLLIKWLVLNWILPCWFSSFLWCVGFWGFFNRCTGNYSTCYLLLTQAAIITAKSIVMNLVQVNK